MSSREDYFKKHRRDIIPADNKKGYKVRYTYIGDWYRWDLEKEEFKRKKIQLVSMALFDIIIYIITATLPSVLNTVSAVAVGGLLSLAALVFESIAIIQFSSSGLKIKDDDCHEIKTKLRAAAFIRTFLLCIAFLGCLTALMDIGSVSGMDIMAVAGYLFCAIISTLVYRISSKIDFSILPGDGSSFTG